MGSTTAHFYRAVNVIPTENAAVAVKPAADDKSQQECGQRHKKSRRPAHILRPFLSAVSLCVVQQTACEHHALAALGKLALDFEAEALCLVLNDDLAAVLNDAADICDNEVIALITGLGPAA